MKKIAVLLYGLYTVFTYLVMGVLIMIWQQKDRIMVGRDCIIFWITYGVYCLIVALFWGCIVRETLEIPGKNRRRIVFVIQAILVIGLVYEMLFPICNYGVQLDRMTLQKYGVQTRWMFVFYLLYILDILFQRKVKKNNV